MLGAGGGENTVFAGVFGEECALSAAGGQVEQVINDFCEGATSTIFACGPRVVARACCGSVVDQ